MKRIIFSTILLLAAISCGKKEQLEEVEIPQPNEKVKEDTPKSSPKDVVGNDGPFKMLGLKYEYNALEPYMDAQTVETHYSKHHLGYLNKLNDAIKGTEMESKTIEDILKGLDLENKMVRNNAGGYFNHNLFWDILAPNKGGEPTGKIAEIIKSKFGSYEEFKKQFSDASSKVFGSGWTWLVIKDNGEAAITTTANQDNPLMPNAEIKGKPVLALDVWEHAYYLKYTNKRADYIAAFFNLINWDSVNEKLEN